MTTAAPIQRPMLTRHERTIADRAKIDGYHGYAPDLLVADEMAAARQAAMDQDGVTWTQQERLVFAVWFYSGWYLRMREVKR